MKTWICNKCNVEVEQVDDIGLSYKEIELPPALGYRCPSCRLEYLEMETVVNELNPAEEMLEGK